MPFSIKKFAQLHRSHSLPQHPQQPPTSTNKQKQNDSATKTSDVDNEASAKSSTNQQTTSKKSSKKTSKLPKQQDEPSVNESSSTKQQSQPHPQLSAHHQMMVDGTGSTVATISQALAISAAAQQQLRQQQLLQQQQQQQQQNVPPPSYKISQRQHQMMTSGSIQGGAGSPSPSPLYGSNNSNVIPAIPNSRSFDAAANEIYRLANQSNVVSSQAMIRNRIKLQQQNSSGSIGSSAGSAISYGGTGPLRSNLHHSLSVEMNDSKERSGTPEPTAPVTGAKQKRVHYAQETKTTLFSKSLNSPPTPAKPLRPSILPRQTSTTTPTVHKTTTTTAPSTKFHNASSTTTNTTTNCVQTSLALNLPRGGEEVLINGGGHHRSRSSTKSSSNSGSSAVGGSSRHHYGKHSFTSNSIDVAIADHHPSSSVAGTSAATETNKSIAMDSDLSRNKTSSTNAAAKSTFNDQQNKNEQQNAASNESANSRQNQRSSNASKSQTIVQQSSSSNRSQSTTPFDHRNYYYHHHFPTNPTSLFDEDPGIMSEIETSATGFRRSNKVRSSLPIVRTPSKSQDRSLGLVFLQFRNETKRALLPNEITSIDTVKALFVRSFPRQLTMEYLDHISVRIYIHDPNKDMFYELEDLRDVKDRSILRIYEQGVNGPQPAGGIIHQSILAQAAGPPTFASGHEGENYGYFSEPEFDSEYQSQHIHRKRYLPPPIVGQSLMAIGQNIHTPQSQYYGTIMLPPQFRSATIGPRSGFFINQNLPGQAPQPPTRNKPFTNYSQTLPRGTHLMSPNPVPATLNPFGINPSAQPPPKPQRNFPQNAVPQPDIIMIQSLQARPAGQPIPPVNAAGPNETQPIPAGPYHQNRPLPDRPYSVAGHYPTIDRTGARFSFAAARNAAGDFSGYLSSPEHRPPNAIMSMQTGQLRASFSGPYPSPATARVFDPNLAAVTNAAAAAASLVQNPNAYGTRHPPTANIIDDEARIRMQEMERKIASLTNVVSKALTTGGGAGPKPPPPPKPQSLMTYRSDNNNNLSPDNLAQLRQIRRKARDLRSEVRQLKRFTVQQINTAKETMKDNCNKIQLTLSILTKGADAPVRLERIKISAKCDAYNEDALRLDKDLLELEAQVEALRSNVINRRCRVNMSNVESMALILSRASKTVADLKARYPLLAQNLKTIMSRELHEIEKEEKFLKEEPERLEHSLKRCKKLTGTLVTLKRLASVQEQRSSSNANTSSPSQMLLQSTSSSLDKKDSGGSGDENSSSGTAIINTAAGRDSLMTRSYDVDLMEPHTIIQVTPATPSSTDSSSKTATSNMLDNLLDELQTFSKQSSIERDTSPSSSSRSPFQRTSGSFRSIKSNLTSATAPGDSDTIIRKASRSKSYSSIRATSEPPGARARGSSIPDGKIDFGNIALLASTCGNAAAATAALVEKRFAQSRQELLEQRHQELLHKQRQLQEQYTRLQQLSKRPMARGFLNDLKKTGSESNLVSKASDLLQSSSLAAVGGHGTSLQSSTQSSSSANKILINSTVHGSLHNIASNAITTTTNLSSNVPSTDKLATTTKLSTANENGTVNMPNEITTTRKTFETEIL